MAQATIACRQRSRPDGRSAHDLHPKMRERLVDGQLRLDLLGKVSAQRVLTSKDGGTPLRGIEDPAAGRSGRVPPDRNRRSALRRLPIRVAGQLRGSDLTRPIDLVSALDFTRILVGADCIEFSVTSAPRSSRCNRRHVWPSPSPEAPLTLRAVECREAQRLDRPQLLQCR